MSREARIRPTQHKDQTSRYPALEQDIGSFDPETKDVFKDLRVLGAFRRDTNLKASLVRSSLQTNASAGDDLTGTVPCNRPRCKTCAHTNASPQINTPGGPLTIQQRFSCATSNLVYLITCRACTLAYIGETGRRLGVRFCEHLRSVKRKRPCPWQNISALPGTQLKT